MDPDLTPIADTSLVRAKIHDDLTFEFGGITGPRRLVLTHAPDGWMLKAIRVNGIEATDAVLPFGTADQSLRDVEVVLTTRVTHLASPRQDARGQAAAAGYRAIVFPTDPRAPVSADRDSSSVARRIATATVIALGPSAGRLLRRGDRHGARRSVWWKWSWRICWNRSSADATKVTLTEGESRSVSVRVIER